MRQVEISDVAVFLRRLSQENDSEPVIVSDRGRPIAAVIPLAGIDAETIAVSLSPTFRAIIERAEARRRAEGGISHEEMKRRLGMGVGADDRPKEP